MALAIDNAGLAWSTPGSAGPRHGGAAAPLFERFGLAGFESTAPRELSGGMRQRVAFLRTLLAGKGVLLLDEPFAALDALTREELQSWLVEALAQEPRTVLLVTHDVDEALRSCRPDRGAVGAAGAGRCSRRRRPTARPRQVLEALRG